MSADDKVAGPGNALPTDIEWVMPGPLGYPDSIQVAGAVAAPLLGGFSLTIAVLLLPDISKPNRSFGRWGDLSLGLLFAGAMLFVMTVQCALTARSYQVTPDELLTWWGRPGGPPSAAMIANQKQHSARNVFWANFTRRTYNLGILLLLAALPLTILPPGKIPTGRAVVATVLAAGFLVELIWVAASGLRNPGPPAQAAVVPPGTTGPPAQAAVVPPGTTGPPAQAAVVPAGTTGPPAQAAVVPTA